MKIGSVPMEFDKGLKLTIWAAQTRAKGGVVPERTLRQLRQQVRQGNPGCVVNSRAPENTWGAHGDRPPCNRSAPLRQ